MKKTFSGRSMIEMLGVLAIIGVLSAGGVWGYNLAMDEYRANQAINDIQKITAQAVQFFKTTSNKSNSMVLNTYDLCRLGMIEDNYCKTLSPCTHGTSWSSCTFDTALGKKTAAWHIFGRNAGTNWEMTIEGKPVTIKGPSYGIHPELYGIPDRACVKILTHNWASMGGFLTHAYLSRGGYFYLPVSVAKAQTLCKDMQGSGVRLGIWTWTR